MKKNKIVSLLLALILFLPVVNTPAAEEGANRRYENETGFLKSVGILDEDFDAEATVKKSEFSRYLARILYPDLDLSDTPSAGPSLFADVEASHPDYNYIKICKDLHIVKGDFENNFHPDSEITVLTGVTMLVNALGYTPYAQQKGGFPTGYFQVALESGMAKGVDLSQTEAAKAGTVAKLIYNSLFADLVSIDSVSDNDIYFSIDHEKNLLSHHLGIEEYDVRVMDNGITSIASPTLGDVQRVALREMGTGVKIVAYQGNSQIGKYLGSRMRVFIHKNKETGRDEVVWASFHKANNITSLSADSILHINSDYIEYEEEKDSGKFKKIKLDALPPVVVLNGVVMNSQDIATLKPADGFIQVVDHDNSGSAELLIITSFNYKNGAKGDAWNIVVDSLNEDEGFIGCKFDPSNSLILTESEALYSFAGNPNYNRINDLDEMMVVSVAQSPMQVDGKWIYTLYVSDEIIEGEISEKKLSENIVTVDSQDYTVSTSITGVKRSYVNALALHAPMTFLLDATGKIAFGQSDVIQGKNYAYLINAGIEKGADDQVKVKLFMKDGSIKELDVSPSVLVNGTSYKGKTALDISNAIMKRYPGSTKIPTISRPVIVELNNQDVVIKLDTDYPNNDAESNITLYTTQHFIPYTQEEVDNDQALKAGYRNLRTGRVERLKRSLESRFYLTNDTVIMNVPEIDPYGIDKFTSYVSDRNNSSFNQVINDEMVKLYEREKEDENYQIISLESLSDLHGYDIQGYDIDPDTGVAGLVILRGRIDTYLYGKVPYTSANPMQIFLKKSEVYDETLEKNIVKLYYTKDGYVENTVLADPDDLLFSYSMIINGGYVKPYDMNVPALTKGDVIRVIQTDGWLDHIERVARVQTVEDTAHSMALFPTNPRMMYSTNLNGLAGSFPNDQRAYFVGFGDSYAIGMVYAKQIRGNKMLACYGKTFAKDVDLSNPSTYAEQYLDIGGIPIITVNVDANGEVRVKNGEISDIKFIEPTKGREQASLVIYKHMNLRLEQIIVINKAG